MSQELPILAYEEQIVEAVRLHQVTVIAAETGAGKSTQVPLMLLRAGFGREGMIGITQPRRVAAMSVAEYVAQCHGTRLGDVIGYQIRGERVLGQQTRVKFMTEGILLREIHPDWDPQLRKYEIVIVDEAHERGINQDLILALLKRVLRERPDLKVIIMSATMNEERFAQHFADEKTTVPIIRVPGRVFPVEVRYEQETPFRPVDACVAKVADIVRSGERGDVLVFLPDEQTIKQACDGIEGERLSNVRVLPLYGNQSPDEQRLVFERTRERRVIVATNIAETSLTIDGVIHVVDSGLVKGMCYVSAGMSALRVMEHSQAGCTQRAGRAGRTQPGVCHRLFTREEFEDREPYTEPEIRRMALDQILLHLRVLGYSMDEIREFEFMDPPGDRRWDEAEERLMLLGALDKDGAVTKDGKVMEGLPVAPILGRMILAAAKFGCVREIVTIAAAFTARQVFVRPRGKEYDADEAHTRFKGLHSDALSLLHAYKAWCAQKDENGNRNAWARDNFLSSRALREIDRNREQLLGILAHEGVELSSTENDVQIRKAVTAGLIVNLCHGRGRMYQWGARDDIFIHPGSVLFALGPELFVCASIVQTKKAFARECTAVEAQWLLDIVPAHQIRRVIVKDWDAKASDYRWYLVQTWRSIELSREPITDETALTPEERATYRDEVAREESLRKAEEEEDAQWQAERKAARAHAEEERTREAEARRAEIQPQREELESLRARANVFTGTDAADIQMRISDALQRCDSHMRWGGEWHLDALRRSMSEIRSGIVTLAYEQETAIADNAEIWRAVTERFPACPFCGGAWREERLDLRCTTSHVWQQIVPLAHGADGYTIGTFVTDRDERAAVFSWEHGDVLIMFTTLRGHAWRGKRVKHVEWKPLAVILPVELLPERDIILRDLAELREARQKLERMLAQVKQAEMEVGAGGMKRLTFREEGGLAVAEEGGVRYQAAFAEVYPQVGETWYCSLGIELPVRGKMVREVHPRLKAETTHEDLAELVELFREMHPGVPSELLQS